MIILLCGQPVRILDYRIVNEVVEEEHYAVTVEAAVGDLPDAQCQARSPQQCYNLCPHHQGRRNSAPAWTRQFADMAVRDVVMLLEDQPSLNVQVATGTETEPGGTRPQQRRF